MRYVGNAIIGDVLKFVNALRESGLYRVECRIRLKMLTTKRFYLNYLSAKGILTDNDIWRVEATTIISDFLATIHVDSARR